MPFMPLSPTRLFSGRTPTGLSASPTSNGIKSSQNMEIRHCRESPSSLYSEFGCSEPGATESKHEAQIETASWGEEFNLGYRPKGRFPKTIECTQQSRQDTGNAEAVLSTARAFTGEDTAKEALQIEPHVTSMTKRQSEPFDDESVSEYSIEEEVGPILGRASSVRVGKPRIVQHRPTKTMNLVSNPSSHSRSNSPSSQKAERILDHQNEMLPSISEQTALRPTRDNSSVVKSNDVQDSALVTLPKPLQPLKSPMPAPVTGQDDDGSPVPLYAGFDSALPTSGTLRSLHPSIGGPGDPSTVSVGALKGGLSRALSAPLPLPGKGLSRRVTIRPTDIITKNYEDHISFRDTVVTTPYPSNLPSEVHSTETNEAKTNYLPNVAPGKRRKGGKQNLSVSFPTAPNEKDRFPSPEPPEVLLLDLGLHRHPHARASVEIEITDKTTFDDQAMFEQIRATCLKKLLLPHRRALTIIRKAQYVTTNIAPSESRQSINSQDFLEHLRNPKVGRKQKSWFLWIQNCTNITSNQSQPQIRNEGPRIRQIDNLNHLSLHSRSSPHSRHSSQSTKSLHTDRDLSNTPENQRLSTASDASSFYFAYSPAIPKLPFLSTGRDTTGNLQPKTQSPSRSFFWPSISGSPSIHNTADCESSRGLTIWFHYEFRFGVIALLTLLNVLLGIACAAVWVVFGVPGTRPGMNQEERFRDGVVTMDWRVNSQGRVLTGVVIGLVVFLIGLLFEGGLVWVSWVLL